MRAPQQDAREKGLRSVERRMQTCKLNCIWPSYIPGARDRERYILGFRQRGAVLERARVPRKQGLGTEQALGDDMDIHRRYVDISRFRDVD